METREEQKGGRWERTKRTKAGRMRTVRPVY